MQRNPSFGQSLDQTVVRAIRDFRETNPKAPASRLIEHLTGHYAGHVRGQTHAYELVAQFNAQFCGASLERANGEEA